MATKLFWCSQECRTLRGAAAYVTSAKNAADSISNLKLRIVRLRWERQARAHDGRCQGCGCTPQAAAHPMNCVCGCRHPIESRRMAVR